MTETVWEYLDPDSGAEASLDVTADGHVTITTYGDEVATVTLTIGAVKALAAALEVLTAAAHLNRPHDDPHPGDVAHYRGDPSVPPRRVLKVDDVDGRVRFQGDDPDRGWWAIADRYRYTTPVRPR